MSGAGSEEADAVEVALLDETGLIISVNQAWTDFCLDNNGDPRRTGVGTSYLGACDGVDDPAAAQVRASIELALVGGLSAPITMRIPCDSPDEPRWFDVLVSSRFEDGRCIGATVSLSRSRAGRRPPAHEVAFPDLPRQEMEHLVGELTTRVQNVLTSHNRVRALLRACASIADEDGLDAVLAAVIAAARELVPCASATIGEREEAPGPAAVSRPIRARGDVFGWLTLTGLVSGGFSDEDERLLSALAVSAGQAIGNALGRAEVADLQAQIAHLREQPHVRPGPAGEGPDPG